MDSPDYRRTTFDRSRGDSRCTDLRVRNADLQREHRSDAIMIQTTWEIEHLRGREQQTDLSRVGSGQRAAALHFKRIQRDRDGPEKGRGE